MTRPQGPALNALSVGLLGPLPPSVLPTFIAFLLLPAVVHTPRAHRWLPVSPLDLDFQDKELG